MTNALAVRADSYGKNLDINRQLNAQWQGTGPWKVNPKRLWKERCWVVVYRGEYPDVIATLDRPERDPTRRHGGDRHFLKFRQALSVHDDLRFDCKPWGEPRNPILYTTLEEILPDDMEEEYLELLNVQDWADYTLLGKYIRRRRNV